MTTFAQFQALNGRPYMAPAITKPPRRTPPIGHPMPGTTPATPKPPTAPKPPKPAAPKPTPPADPFKAWYMTDPRFLQQNPLFAAQEGQTYAQYGWNPILNAHGVQVRDSHGNPEYRQQTAAENPYSAVNQLAQALAGNSQRIQESANSRGLLFSGAQAQQQQNATSDYDKQLDSTRRAFEQALGGINQQRANLITSLYPDYLKTAPPGGVAKTTSAAGKTTSGSKAGGGAAPGSKPKPQGVKGAKAQATAAAKTRRKKHAHPGKYRPVFHVGPATKKSKHPPTIAQAKKHRHNVPTHTIVGG